MFRIFSKYVLTKNDKLSTDNINGGYEINGTYGFSKDFKIDSLKGGNLWDGDLDYIMALGTKKGYDIYRTYYFKRHLPECTDRIFVLKRKGN